MCGEGSGGGGGGGGGGQIYKSMQSAPPPPKKKSRLCGIIIECVTLTVHSMSWEKNYDTKKKVELN